MTKEYDVVIIGAGPGGMTAALYASRANLKVLMLDRGAYGGQMNNTAAVENYPGFKSILGPDLAEEMYQSATQFGAEYAYGTVTAVKLDGTDRIVVTDDGEYRAKAVIVATGSENRKLGVPGEEKYSGRGVSYCAVCDGAFFRDRDVTVIGGGDSAVEESIYLTQMVKHVNIVHRRDQLRAQKVAQERAFKNDKIDFTWNSNVIAINGDDQKVTSVTVKNNQTGAEEEVPTAGVFIYVGNVPMTAPFKDLGITDEHGWMVTDNWMRTKVPGIFAIGDVRQHQLQQITTAVGDGGIAGQEVFSYLQELN
ncbi:thioredoxin-disulfide reductase [Ligilactobacillus hohenheimensis]|uniref:thioredoxin-disulfide reductase n=1 Tax=Ligilactobacillus hohenheimensis TaxID=2991832 RepID=UPI0024BA40C8|nr:thioredoxin-disulfide reductase [Ligilactobacillus hohenheimensis]